MNSKYSRITRTAVGFIDREPLETLALAYSEISREFHSYILASEPKERELHDFYTRVAEEIQDTPSLREKIDLVGRFSEIAVRILVNDRERGDWAKKGVPLLCMPSIEEVNGNWVKKSRF